MKSTPCLFKNSQKHYPAFTSVQLMRQIYPLRTCSFISAECTFYFHLLSCSVKNDHRFAYIYIWNLSTSKTLHLSEVSLTVHLQYTYSTLTVHLQYTSQHIHSFTQRSHVKCFVCHDSPSHAASTAEAVHGFSVLPCDTWAWGTGQAGNQTTNPALLPSISTC